MSAKKKLNIEILMEQDEVLVALKERYFNLLKKENYPKTPQLTTTLDKIEGVINKRIEEIKNV